MKPEVMRVSDFSMPDLMKVGGVTGWLRVAGQAEAASILMSSHLFAEGRAMVAQPAYARIQR
jgi:mandelate racemase